MNANKTRRLLISKTPARKGLIYEALADNKDYKLEVKLSVITRKWLKFISVVGAWKLEFQSSEDSTVVLIRPNTLVVELSSLEGAPKGNIREARLSKISKAIVEDESGRTLGWIDYGLKKDHLFLGDGREVGFVVRLPRKDFPLILSPSKAYRLDHFECVHDLVTDFDDRLIYAWISRKVWQEHHNS